MTVSTFSGAHPFRPQCVIEALERDHDLTHDEQVEVAAQMVECIEDGRCPGCGQRNAAFEVDSTLMPAGSRATACRCIPICPACGELEGMTMPPTPSGWSAFDYDDAPDSDEQRGR